MNPLARCLILLCSIEETLPYQNSFHHVLMTGKHPETTSDVSLLEIRVKNVDSAIVCAYLKLHNVLKY